MSTTPPQSMFDQHAALKPTAALVLADGKVFKGYGIGKPGMAVGEICFNTAMSGYQEILTDPSYAAQIVTFTFPHIGNVGTNAADHETASPYARGLVLRQPITPSANFRAESPLLDWLEEVGLVGVTGIDTRALTHHIRSGGAPNGVVVHAPDGVLDTDGAASMAKDFPGLEGMDLTGDVTSSAPYEWTQTQWTLGSGYGTLTDEKAHVVCIDYGVKRNILRNLASVGARITVVPARTPAKDILAMAPDGIFLSNGPGDPHATATWATPILQELVASDLPIFGICLGHQLLALALGAQTEKMHQGHRGANHPVKDETTNKVEITSMNHGFMVSRESLPSTLEETHRSLFDGTLCGLRVKGKPIFSVQHHPEASPGPQDSFYLFERFMDAMTLRAPAPAAV
ncbi:MAG: glutamine-hydrolyzing carbamoyl-phosphate synthase small subunit [Pseudomonadota bacterium]